jgi:arylsulfatase A-like enzyme
VSLAFNHGPKSTTGIHPDEVTVAELLHDAGYATFMIGKWHLGSRAPYLPHYNGFDHWFGLPYSNDMWPYHPLMPPQPNEDDRMKAARERADYTGYAGQGRYYDLEKGQGFPEKLPLMSDDEVLELNPDQTQLTKRYTDRALAFIEENKEREFFLYLPHAMPHVPLFALEARKGTSIRGLYGDVVEEIDWSVGKILDKLKELGIDEKTLVIYTSDNGPWLQYGVDGGSAGMFRDGKGTTYEGGMRVPGIFRWPGKIPAGQVSSEPAANMDILPTFARLAGAQTPRDRVIDGRDLWPLLTETGARSPHEQYYYFGGGRDRANIQGVREGRWKLRVQRTAGGALEADALYDLQEDAAEKFDRRILYPDLVRRLLSITEQFVRELEGNVRPLGGS